MILTYEEYKQLIYQYYEDYDKLLQLQDDASNPWIDSEELKANQALFEEEYRKFDKKCKGEYITFPVVNKDGTHELKMKKVEEGIYEKIIPTFTSCNSYLRAIVKLRDMMNITEEDETLCCSEAKYKDTIQDKEWLEKKINEYQKELQKAKKIIQDYEIVHNGPWEEF